MHSCDLTAVGAVVRRGRGTRCTLDKDPARRTLNRPESDTLSKVFQAIEEEDEAALTW